MVTGDTGDTGTIDDVRRPREKLMRQQAEACTSRAVVSQGLVERELEEVRGRPADRQPALGGDHSSHGPTG
jgi:hypothetical protein